MKKKTARDVEPQQLMKGFQVPEVRMVRLDDLNFAPYNPRIMPPGKMKALKASLAKHGLVLNLVVQATGMVIIGGHQRVTALRELCAERGWAVPEFVSATVLNIDDAAARQLNVGLNNIEGEFDHYKLGAMFTDILAGMTVDDVLATGFEHDNIAELVRLAGDPGEEARRLEEEAADLSSFAKSVTLTVEFDTVELRDAAKELLSAAAKAREVKPGAILLEAIQRQLGPAKKASKAKASKPKGDRAQA